MAYLQESTGERKLLPMASTDKLVDWRTTDLVVSHNEQRVNCTRLDAMDLQALPEAYGLVRKGFLETYEALQAGGYTLKDTEYLSMVSDTVLAVNKVGVTKMEEQGRLLQRVVVDRLLENKQLEEYRDEAAGDTLSAAMIGIPVLTEVVQLLDRKTMQELQDAQDRMDNAESEQQAAESMADDPSVDSQDAVDAANQAKQAMAQAQAMAQSAMQRANGQLSPAKVAKIVKGALEEAEKTEEFCQSWGQGTDDVEQVPFEEKLKIAETLSRRPAGDMRKLMDLTGKLTQEADFTMRAKIHSATGSVVDMEMGGEIGLIMEDELAPLLKPGMRRAALLALAQESMAQMMVDGEDEGARGDLLIYIDESSSMNDRGAMGLTLESEAKVVALALVNVMARQNRRAVVKTFQDSVTSETKIGTRGAESLSLSMAKLASRGTAGGTSFDEPLCDAVKCAAKSGLRKPDVLFITDGACSVESTTKAKLAQAKRAQGMRLMTVYVGGCDAKSDASGLAGISDKTWDSKTLFSTVGAGVAVRELIGEVV